MAVSWFKENINAQGKLYNLAWTTIKFDTTESYTNTSSIYLILFANTERSNHSAKLDCINWRTITIITLKKNIIHKPLKE